MSTDQYKMCKDCQTEFVFTEGEQEFYRQKGFPDPKRCARCRAERRRQREMNS